MQRRAISERELIACVAPRPFSTALHRAAAAAAFAMRVLLHGQRFAAPRPILARAALDLPALGGLSQSPLGFGAAYFACDASGLPGAALGPGTGTIVGPGTGTNVGTANGMLVGTGTGIVLGVGTGTGVGTAIGTALGAGTGTKVGAGIGTDVGPGIGTALGPGKGNSVGPGTGTALGAGKGTAEGAGGVSP